VGTAYIATRATYNYQDQTNKRKKER